TKVDRARDGGDGIGGRRTERATKGRGDSWVAVEGDHDLVTVAAPKWATAPFGMISRGAGALMNRVVRRRHRQDSDVDEARRRVGISARDLFDASSTVDRHRLDTSGSLVVVQKVDVLDPVLVLQRIVIDAHVAADLERARSRRRRGSS